MLSTRYCDDKRINPNNDTPERDGVSHPFIWYCLVDDSPTGFDFHMDETILRLFPTTILYGEVVLPFL